MKTFETVEQIKQERQLQRENPVIYSLLGVLLGEIDRLPIPRTQSPSEDQIYAIIKKMHEAAKEMREMTPEADQEYMYLKDFIKKQLSEADIRFEIEDLMLSKGCNIGVIMKHFKDNYPGQYDGKLVSQIAKEML
jgi:uncharacterized protein YqeY